MSEPAPPAPSSSSAPRTYDPDGGALATFLAATSSAPWLEPVDAASLLSDSGADQAVEQATPATAGRRPPRRRPVLTARRLAQMAEQRDTLLSVSSVLRDGEEFERTYREVLDELASTRWRYQPGSWATLSTSVARDIRAATSAIRVVPRTSTINLLAENGTLRITVENGLDYTVQDIRLRLVPDNPAHPGRRAARPGDHRTPVTHERPRGGRRRRRRPRRDPRLPHDGRRHPDRLAGHHPRVGQPARRRHLLGRRDPRRPRPARSVSSAPSSRAPHASTRSPTSRHVTAAHESLGGADARGSPTEPA